MKYGSHPFFYPGWPFDCTGLPEIYAKFPPWPKDIRFWPEDSILERWR